MQHSIAEALRYGHSGTQAKFVSISGAPQRIYPLTLVGE